MLLGQHLLAVGDVPLGLGLAGGVRAIAPGAQVLSKARDGVLIALVLFEAAALVEDVRHVLGLDEQLREDGDSSGVVAVEACLARLVLLGAPVSLGDGKRGPRGTQDGGEGNPSETLTHGGTILGVSLALGKRISDATAAGRDESAGGGETATVPAEARPPAQTVAVSVARRCHRVGEVARQEQHGVHAQ